MSGASIVHLARIATFLIYCCYLNNVVTSHSEVGKYGWGTTFFEHFSSDGCYDSLFYHVCNISCVPKKNLNLKRYWYFKKILEDRKNRYLYGEEILLDKQYTPDLYMFRDYLAVRITPENQGEYICRLVNESRVYQQLGASLSHVRWSSSVLPYFNVRGDLAVFTEILSLSSPEIRIYKVTDKRVSKSKLDNFEVIGKRNRDGCDEKRMRLEKNQEYVYCYNDKLCSYFKTRNYSMPVEEGKEPYILSIYWIAPQELRLRICRKDESISGIPLKLRATVLDSGDKAAPYYELILDMKPDVEMYIGDIRLVYHLYGFDIGKTYGVSVGFHDPVAIMNTENSKKVVVKDDVDPVADITILEMSNVSMLIHWEHPYSHSNIMDYYVFCDDHLYFRIEYPLNTARIQRNGQLTKFSIKPYTGERGIENTPDFFIKHWDSGYETEVVEEEAQRETDEDPLLATLKAKVEEKELEASKLAIESEDLEESLREIRECLTKLKKAEEDVAAEWESTKTDMEGSFIVYFAIIFVLQCSIIATLLKIIYRNIQKAKGDSDSTAKTTKSKRKSKQKSSRKKAKSEVSTPKLAQSSKAKSNSSSTTTQIKSKTSSSSSTTTAAKK